MKQRGSSGATVADAVVAVVGVAVVVDDVDDVDTAVLELLKQSSPITTVRATAALAEATVDVVLTVDEFSSSESTALSSVSSRSLFCMWALLYSEAIFKYSEATLLAPIVVVVVVAVALWFAADDVVVAVGNVRDIVAAAVVVVVAVAVDT